MEFVIINGLLCTSYMAIRLIHDNRKFADQTVYYKNI